MSVASSKSAIKIFAPELRALITIFRSVGPVISTRRSCRSFGSGQIVQFSLRIIPFQEETMGESLDQFPFVFDVFLLIILSVVLPNFFSNCSIKFNARGVKIFSKPGSFHQQFEYLLSVCQMLTSSPLVIIQFLVSNCII